MSLIKLLKIPSRLFKKDVITFLIIRRQDLGISDDKLRYIAVRPGASISQLRHKVWHLLDLPDYCEEAIILKTEDGHELPLKHLRKGNDPQHPYILEVYGPGKQTTPTMYNNMITYDNKNFQHVNYVTYDGAFNEKINQDYKEKLGNEHSFTTMNNETLTQNKILQNIKSMDNAFKKSDLSCKMSTSSIFFRIHGRKSRDNFANILLKIQSDLTTLNSKLSDLETRIQV